MPHARCTKYELSLLYIFSFACQAHLRHGGAAAAPSSAGLDCAVIRMTAKNNKKKTRKIAKKNGKKKYKLWQMGANFNEIQQRKANKVNEEQARQRKERRLVHSLSHPHTHSLTHTARCQQRNIKKALTAKQG